MPTNIRQQQTPQEILRAAPRSDTANDEIVTVADVAALLKCKSSSIYDMTRRRGRHDREMVVRSAAKPVLQRVGGRSVAKAGREWRNFGCAAPQFRIVGANRDEDSFAL